MGWLARLTLTLALLGIVGFELLSIVVVKIQAQDIGQEAAQAAIATYQDSPNTEAAFQAASASAEASGATIRKKTFQISTESVTFEMDKLAPTLFLYRWDRSASMAEVHTTVYAEPIEAGGQLP